MTKKFFSQNGFTLIELMVTITIIAIMFGVVISSANFLRSTSGDAKRKADIAAIKSALQNYYADLNYFPHSGTGGLKLSGTGASPALTSSVGIASPAPSPAPPLKTYMNEIPSDPASPYCYIAVNNQGQNNTDCNTSTTNRCQYYYLTVRLDTPSPAMSLPESLQAQCAGINYVVTP